MEEKRYLEYKAGEQCRYNSKQQSPCDSLITNNFRCNYAKNVFLSSVFVEEDVWQYTHNNRVRTHCVTKQTAFHTQAAADDISCEWQIHNM